MRRGFDVALSSTLALFVAALGVCACSKHETVAPSADGPAASASSSEPAWPAFPSDEATADRLIQQSTTRKPEATSPLTPEAIRAAIASGAEHDRLRAGWDAVARELGEPMREAARGGHRSYLLFGTFHDSAAQIEAFRRVSGLLGVAASDAVVEQFQADGHWQGVKPELERGDSAALARFWRDGDRRALDVLLSALRDHDHTAWKYDHTEEMLALPATLRAAGVEVRGCDMPTALQARARALGDERVMRLRELHCTLALEVPEDARVSMLWGDEHVEPSGVMRFLPADASISVVHVRGGRPEDADEKLRLAEPLLVPLDGTRRFALLLAEGVAHASVDRSRTPIDAADAARVGKLEVTSTSEVDLWLAGKRTHVGSKPIAIALSAGNHAFLANGAMRLAGNVPMPDHGFVELALDPATSNLRITIHR